MSQATSALRLPPRFNRGIAIEGPAASVQIKIGAKKLGSGIALWEKTSAQPLQMGKRLAFSFLCFRSEGGLGASGSSSSPVRPFCSGLLKPNAGKDSPTPHPALGGGGSFFYKTGPGPSAGAMIFISAPLPNSSPTPGVFCDLDMFL